MKFRLSNRALSDFIYALLSASQSSGTWVKAGFKKCVVLIVACSGLQSLAFAEAQNTKTYNSTSACMSENLISFKVVNASLNDVLGLVTNSCGIKYTPRRAFSVPLLQTNYSGTPLTLLEGFSREHQFSWSLNDGRFSVVTGRRKISRLIKAKLGDASSLRQELRELGWLVSSGALTSAANGDMIKATGDEEFVAIVELLQEERVNQRGVAPKIRIIRSGRG